MMSQTIGMLSIDGIPPEAPVSLRFLFREFQCSFEATTNSVAIAPAVSSLRDIEACEPCFFQLVFQRFQGVASSGRLVDLSPPNGFARGSIVLEPTDDGYKYRVELNIYDLTCLMCAAFCGVHEDDFLALAMLSKIAEGSFSSCGDHLVRSLFASSYVDETAETYKMVRQVPRPMLSDKEFLNRLRNPKAPVFADDLKHFIGIKNWSTLKGHLIDSGLLRVPHGGSVPRLTEWWCTAEALLDRFIPYLLDPKLRKRKQLDPKFDDFLDRLETAGVTLDPTKWRGYKAGDQRRLD